MIGGVNRNIHTLSINYSNLANVIICLQMLILISVLVATLVTFIFLPVIIKVSKSIDLLDAPDIRKVHSVSIPSLGGVGIFIGFMLAIGIALPFVAIAEMKFFIAGIVITFLLGVRDDISSLEARQKVSVQLLCAFMVVYFSEVKLQGLYGIFGIESLPFGLASILSIFLIVALTNSYNLIDGIDGLAGSVALLVLTFFGWLFFQVGVFTLATLCFALSGALFAFLFFNWFPAKIFMGDTGSMMLGFVISVLAVQIINKTQGAQILDIVRIESSVGLAVGALILPIYDTLRVMTIRISRGISPFFPDRNHLHHALLKLGLNHAKATSSLLLVNFAILALSFVLNGILSNGVLILLDLAIIVSFGILIDFLGRKKRFMAISKSATSDLYISKSA